jgi:hypothetical protein
MRSPNRLFAPMLGVLGALFPAILASCVTKAQPPGEVVVVVTSDMVVPEDIDTLTWSVTIGDAGAPFKDGSYPLLGPSQLPATLAIVSGHETRGPVRVQLDALRAGTLRVHREAVLETVPDDGKVRQLVMPLNWLCSYDANPSLSCGSGETCQAGACVKSAAIDVSDLPPYSAPDAECFNVDSCFQVLAGGNEQLPTSSAGSCTAPSNLSGTGADVNVALVVNTSHIGNYGACIASGNYHSCLIPLAHGAPEGWTFTDDSETAIRLPASVCHDVDVTQTLGGVMVSPSCPSKPLENPTCRPPDMCIPTRGVCPDDWGSADWQGYTCSGSAYPKGVVWCNQPPAILDAGTETDGGANGRRLCFSLGPEGLPDSGLLIDNMTGGPEVKLTPPSPNEVGGWWFSYSDDDGKSPLFPPEGSLFSYTRLPASVTADGGPMSAARVMVSPDGFSTDAGTAFAGEGFNFVQPKNEASPHGSPFDVSPYTGLRFWAWSSNELGIAVMFPDSNTDSQDPQSTCEKNPDAGGCNPFGTHLVLTQNGAEYHVEWSDLAQEPGWGQRFDGGLVQQQVSATNFQVTGIGDRTSYLPPFEFCVSQIYFTVDGGADTGAPDGGTDAQ